MRKIQIHKNDLRDYFVKRGNYKLGKEKMVRWVDVPEYIVIDINKKKQVKKVKFPFKAETAIGFREVDGYVTPLKSFYLWMEKITEAINTR